MLTVRSVSTESVWERDCEGHRADPRSTVAISIALDARVPGPPETHVELRPQDPEEVFAAWSLLHWRHGVKT